MNQDMGEFGLKPKKSFGQNFLVSDEALKLIVEAAELKSGNKVLEVGPGTGLLTDRLLAAEAEVVAVEKDRELAELLKRKFSEEILKKKLFLINADFLDLDFPKFLEKLGFSDGKFKIVANLPYQITSPFFERVVERNFLPERLVLTLQKEVADNIVAEGKKSGSLGVLLDLCSSRLEIKKIFPPHFFYPQPKVSSALLFASGIKYPARVEIKKMRRLIKIGFSERRKKLIKNFKKTMPELASSAEKIWVKSKLSADLRAEQLKGDDWLNLYRAIFSDNA